MALWLEDRGPHRPGKADLVRSSADSVEGRFKILSASPNPRIEDLMDEAFRCQLQNIRNSRNEPYRKSLMDMFTEANHDVCKTYGHNHVWKYAGAALNVAGGVVGLGQAEGLSKALMGFGTASGSIGQVLDEDYVAKRTHHQHMRDIFNRLVQQTDRSAADAAGHLDSLLREMKQRESDLHQAKTETIR